MRRGALVAGGLLVAAAVVYGYRWQRQRVRAAQWQQVNFDLTVAETTDHVFCVVE